MSTFTWAPAFEPQMVVKPAVRIARFGDGYEQRTADGINNLLPSWSLVFNQAESVIQEIVDFLDATGGWQSFDWTPPRGAAGKFVADQGWTRSVRAPQVDTLTVTFRQVAEP